MTETTVPSPSAAPLEVPRTERVAWGVLLIAFAIFCFSCLMTTLVVYWFFFQSTVPMTVIAEVSRGTVGVTRSDLREEIARPVQVLNVGNVVRPTDPQSQATVLVRDPYYENAVVASLTLNTSSSTVDVRNALRPRFHWNSGAYQVEVRVDGSVDVQIVQGLPHDLVMDLMTRNGTRVRLGSSGHYSLRIDSSGMRVSNYDGEAVIIPASGSVGWPVARGAGVRVPAETGEPESFALNVNLLQNSYFSQTLTRESQSVPAGFGSEVQVYDGALLSWACWIGTQNDPPGRMLTGVQDGRTMVQMVRGNEAQTSGGTYCQQGENVGDDWRDISGFDSLTFRTTFYIEFHSLSTCGEKGSECPLMIRLDFVDTNGDSAHLIFGFYSIRDFGRDYPFTCDSCRQQHVQVNPQSWFTFESGNLLDLFPEDRRPVALSRVQFYASGHEFDMRISELSLLASSTPEAAPEGTEQG
jgi:hypothetical protein